MLFRSCKADETTIAYEYIINNNTKYIQNNNVTSVYGFHSFRVLTDYENNISAPRRTTVICMKYFCFFFKLML